MSLAEARRTSASVGSLVATLPAVLADLSGSLGEKVRRNLPGSELLTSIWEGVRGLRDDGGVIEEEMSDVVPRGWRDRAFRPEKVSASGNSDLEVSEAHDAETTNSHKAQKKPRKQDNRVRYDRYVTSSDGLPPHARPPAEVGPFGESETREFAKARQRSQSGPGVAAWLRARAVDVQRVIPAQELLYAGWRHLRTEEHLAAACPACDAADANTRHARFFHRAGAQVNQHQPLVHATSRFLKRMSVRQVESGAPFNADRDLRMDIVAERGGLRDSSASDFRHKNMLMDVTYADPQAGVHLRAGSAGQMDQLLQLLRRESATTTPAFDMCPPTSAVIGLSPLRWKALSVSAGKEANSSFSWRRVIGGRDGGAMPKKNIC